MTVFDLALQNLLTPMVLFFVLGLAAAFVRSDLSVPEGAAKLLALYLLLSIGFRGGAEIGHQGISAKLVYSIGAGVLLSFAIPFLAYAILRAVTRLKPVDAASVAAHYGSISIVTFVAATGTLLHLSIPFEGHMIAVAAAMETPAILSALYIARRGAPKNTETNGSSVMREVLFNGSVVILVGAFVIGIITGTNGLTLMKPFVVDLFPGFLSLFLLDMGLVAGRGLTHGRRYLSLMLVGFAVVMPLIGASFAAPLALLIGLSVGGTAVLMTLAASASYIAVPAAMRLALPAANPAIALTLSLGVTFPFNLTVGIPLYIAVAMRIAGS